MSGIDLAFPSPRREDIIAFHVIVDRPRPARCTHHAGPAALASSNASSLHFDFAQARSSHPRCIRSNTTTIRGACRAAGAPPEGRETSGGRVVHTKESPEAGPASANFHLPIDMRRPAASMGSRMPFRAGAASSSKGSSWSRRPGCHGPTSRKRRHGHGIDQSSTPAQSGRPPARAVRLGTHGGAILAEGAVEPTSSSFGQVLIDAEARHHEAGVLGAPRTSSESAHVIDGRVIPPLPIATRRSRAPAITRSRPALGRR